ncbi:MAG: TROVE domain-containing protein, partial [Desulfobacterales bacterium]|nr:TROVE domain-containing protein [Desulfobacterales bacterium]
RQPLSSQIKKGIAKAFIKFDEYQLAKYNRDGAVKLRDALFLCHAKPKDKDQEILWKKLIENGLASPDTWEVNLSKGFDKKNTWQRLLKENKLGPLALLRNIRNMQDAGLEEDIILNAIKKMNVERILPFRFIAAVQKVPKFEESLEKAMFKSLEMQEKLRGITILLVDVSGSMDAKLSQKSDISRLDAACGLAMLLREICEKVEVFTFSCDIKSVPSRRGFSLRDAIVNSQAHSGTYLGAAVKFIYNSEIIKTDKPFCDKNFNYMKGQTHRLIVITDEQSHDKIPNPKCLGYMINIASYKNGVGYGEWVHIDGWSEAVIDYIRCYEEILL